MGASDKPAKVKNSCTVGLKVGQTIAMFGQMQERNQGVRLPAPVSHLQADQPPPCPDRRSRSSQCASCGGWDRGGQKTCPAVSAQGAITQAARPKGGAGRSFVPVLTLTTLGPTPDAARSHHEASNLSRCQMFTTCWRNSSPFRQMPPSELSLICESLRSITTK